MIALSRVLVSSDDLAHLSRLCARTLCDRRVSYSPKSPTGTCPICEAKAVAAAFPVAA